MTAVFNFMVGFDVRGWPIEDENDRDLMPTDLLDALNQQFPSGDGARSLPEKILDRYPEEEDAFQHFKKAIECFYGKEFSATSEDEKTGDI